ncbi:MAG TPA: guanylate kinase [Hyphomicrobiaceae bacterium]|nr:guanylate kinase [Hyphomicrobiaceae bacterium]
MNAPIPKIARRGLLLVLSSPSGAGKTTLARELLKTDPGIAMSVSVTTRRPRPGEVDGRDYFFLDLPAFERMRDEGALLEWASVHGNLYGTPKAPVMDMLAAGKDVLFDIDWQGAQQVQASAPEDLVRVFILPPSAGALEERLRRRAQDGDDVVARRLAGAGVEIDHWSEYDYVIVNSDVSVSLAGLTAILAAERLRRTRQNGLEAFVRTLRAAL